MTAVLERRPLTKLEPPDDDLEFAKECAEVLGYNTLLRDHQRATVTTRLRGVLVELDIRPFTKESVEAYKNSQLMAKNGNATDAPQSRAWPMSLRGILGNPDFTEGETRYWQWVRRPLKPQRIENAGMLGHGFTFPSYTRPIPEFALQSALDIKKRCPDAEFVVESFEQQAQVADPFLIVHAGGEEFYIEVWAEHSYKQQREV